MMESVAMTKKLNTGDLRLQIDYETIERNSSKEFADRVKTMFGPNGDWECTYFVEEDNSKYYSLYLANGFYEETQDTTYHDEVVYAQFSKKNGVISINSMNTFFLKRFAPIGITVTE